jgi:hypothetical protein
MSDEAAPDSQRVNRRKLSWAAKGGCKPKPCKVCGVDFKPPTSGHVYCDSCADEAKRRTHESAWRSYRSRNRARTRKAKSVYDLKKYGLTWADYESMLAAQDGKCAICNEPGSGGRGIQRLLAIDHCHATGRVRGLLCHRCNGALGMVRDRICVLKKAIEYLEASRA